MIEKAFNGLLNIFELTRNVGFDLQNLNLRDEVADRPASTNNLFEDGAQPSSVLNRTLQFYHKILGARLPNSLNSDTHALATSVS